MLGLTRAVLAGSDQFLAGLNHLFFAAFLEAAAVASVVRGGRGPSCILANRGAVFACSGEGAESGSGLEQFLIVFSLMHCFVDVYNYPF